VYVCVCLGGTGGCYIGRISFGNSAWYNLMCGVIEMASAFKFHSKDETGSDWGVVASRCLKPEFVVAWIEGIQLGVGGVALLFY